MKSYRVTAAVVFFVVGAWSCGAYATSGGSQVYGYIDNYEGPDLGEVLGLGFDAYAYLRSTGVDEDAMFDWEEAWAEVGDDDSQGSGYASSSGESEAQAYAYSPDGLYTKAIGRGTGQVSFVIASEEGQGGWATFDIEWGYSLDAYTDNPGDWAHSDATFSIRLMNLTSGEESSFTISDSLDVVEGEDWYEDYSTASLSLFFNEGDEGALWMDTYACAEASGPISVPAPGAMVLGSLGMGLVGWLRRRRSL